MNKKTLKEMKEAMVFTKKELTFINKIGKSAFTDGTRPLVLIGICGTILDNIIIQSEGKINKKDIIKWIKMAI